MNDALLLEVPEVGFDVGFDVGREDGEPIDRDGPPRGVVAPLPELLAFCLKLPSRWSPSSLISPSPADESEEVGELRLV